MSKIKFVYSGPAHAAELYPPVTGDAEKGEPIIARWLAPGAEIEIESEQEGHPTVAAWLARGWLTKPDPGSTPVPAAPPARSTTIVKPAPAPTPSAPTPAA